MMRFRRLKTQQEKDVEQCRDIRLADAEKRVGALVDKAEWLHTVVTARDQQNGWQASVDRLFLGGRP